MKYRLSHSHRGFTLVELMAATAIAVMLMAGLSVFITTVFPNVYRMEQKFATVQRQQMSNLVLQKRLDDLKVLITDFTGSPNGTDHVIGLKTRDDAMPFTYIGKKIDEGSEKLAFKDFLVFNKITEARIGDETAQIYGNSGAGTIEKLNLTTGLSTPVVTDLPKNFAGFTKKGNEWLAAVPNQNRVIRCQDSHLSCATPGDYETLNLTMPDGAPYAFDTPMDVSASADGALIFISDSGNNKIIGIDPENRVTILADETDGINLPTGLAYDPNQNFLFFSDTLNHVVKRIDLGHTDRAPVLLTSQIDYAECAGSARACKLRFPTGLFADPVSRHLFIADSGNNRILRISDFGKPQNVQVIFKTGGTAAPIKKIRIAFPPGVSTKPDTALTVTSESDNLSPNGKIRLEANSIDYELFTNLSQDTAANNPCQLEPCELPNKIQVFEPNLFTAGSSIHIPNDDNSPFTYTTRERQSIVLDHNMARDHSSGTEVILASSVPADTQITFTINNVDTTHVPRSYSLFAIKAYGIDDELLFSSEYGLRVGDGILGTEDDIIQIIAANRDNGQYILNLPPAENERNLNTSLLFPTGVSNAFFTNTGRSIIAMRRNAIELNINPLDSSFLEPFDAKSNFDLADEDGIYGVRFELNGTQLKMTIKAKVDDQTIKTHKLNAHVQTFH